MLLVLLLELIIYCSVLLYTHCSHLTAVYYYNSTTETHGMDFSPPPPIKKKKVISIVRACKPPLPHPPPQNM